MDDMEMEMMKSTKSVEILLEAIEMLKIAHSENVRYEKELLMAFKTNVVVDKFDEYLKNFNENFVDFKEHVTYMMLKSFVPF